MDRTGIIVISICVVLMGIWFVNYQKQTANWQEQQRQFALTNKVATATVANPAPAPVTITSTSAAPFETNIPEQTIVLTNNGVRYMFTSRGGGLQSIELLHFPETVSARWKVKDSRATNSVVLLNDHAPVPVLAVLGDTNLIGDGNFALTKTDYGVRAEKNLPDGLMLTKEFYFSSNYLVNVSVRFENPSDKPIVLPAQQYVIGTAAPMDADDNGMYVNSLWFDGTNLQICNLMSYFNTNRTVLGIITRTVKSEYREGASNVVWAAAENQFFALLAMSKTNQPAQQILATAVTLPPLAENSSASRGIQTALIYPEQTLPAKSNFERQIVLFAGPKEYRVLAKIGDEFQNHADLAMNWGTGYISFWGIGTFFAKLLLSAMNWLHDVFKVPYGWTIVLLTVFLRAAFWPFTAASIRSSKKMQAIAPELKAIQDKYKDDPMKLMQKRNEVMKKHNVSMRSGCMAAVIQMPVFFGFLAMIRCAIELRGAHFLWVADLTKPDTVFVVPGLTFLPFSTPQGWPINLLPLLMVGAMVWQAHLQPPSPGMDPAQQKMMRFMPLMFLLFLYSYSSGMALYMTASTMMGILQTQLIMKKMAAAPLPSPLTPAQKSKK